MAKGLIASPNFFLGFFLQKVQNPLYVFLVKFEKS